jgi:elongator complex protein 1
MSLTAGAKNELRSLLFTLVKLGGEEIARKLQLAGENFQLTQMAAVKLAEDTISTDIINEKAHTLEHYIRKMRSELPNLDYFSWRSKVFISP